MEFFLRFAGFFPSAMIVLDAHSDTVANEHYDSIKNFIRYGNFSRAGELAGNHNWIHPLTPYIVETLAIVSAIRGFPRADKLEGFLKTTGTWNNAVRADFLTVEELRFWQPAGDTLFVSVDLDFFFDENRGQDDIPSILDALFAFSSRWREQKQGRLVVWAFCLSRPWLPDNDYAWALLERSLVWLRRRPEFLPPEIALFNSRRHDTSRTARSFRAEGREIPALRETDTPENIKALINELLYKN